MCEEALALANASPPCVADDRTSNRSPYWRLWSQRSSRSALDRSGVPSSGSRMIACRDQPRTRRRDVVGSSCWIWSRSRLAAPALHSRLKLGRSPLARVEPVGCSEFAPRSRSRTPFAIVFTLRPDSIACAICCEERWRSPRGARGRGVLQARLPGGYGPCRGIVAAGCRRVSCCSITPRAGRGDLFSSKAGADLLPVWAGRGLLDRLFGLLRRGGRPKCQAKAVRTIFMVLLLLASCASVFMPRAAY